MALGFYNLMEPQKIEQLSPLGGRSILHTPKWIRGMVDCLKASPLPISQKKSFRYEGLA